MSQWQYMMGEGERCRNIVGIVYEEDARRACGRYETEPHGDNWYMDLVSYMASLHVPCAVSPIHLGDPYSKEDVKAWIERHLDPRTMELDERYRDMVPEVGSREKNHAHVLFVNKGSKSRDQMTELMRGYCPIRETIWQKCASVDGSLRYFAHLDEFESGKQRYDARDVYCFGGLDASALVKTDKLEKSEALFNITMTIYEKKMRYYSQLVRWALDSKDLEIWNTVTGRAPYFGCLFRGLADERAEEAAKKKAEMEAKNESQAN